MQLETFADRLGLRHETTGHQECLTTFSCPISTYLSEIRIYTILNTSTWMNIEYGVMMQIMFVLHFVIIIKLEVCCIIYLGLDKESQLYYRQASYIRRTESQNVNVSRLILQLSLPNPLKPGAKSLIKIQQRRQPVFQPHLGDQQFDCLLY